MKNILAIWNKGYLMNASDAPMYSFSERDEVFVTGAQWQYELPKDWKLFPTKPQLGDFAEVVGEKDGKVLVGYACPLIYILMGEIFQNFEDCQNSKFFHPSDYIECRIEDATKNIKLQQEMLEEGCYGD